MSPLRQLINWIARPYDFLDDCAKSYGDTFTMRLMGFPHWVMLSDTQAIGEIFATDAKHFDAGKGNEIYFKPLLGNNSLAVLDGDRHKRERKMLQELNTQGNDTEPLAIAGLPYLTAVCR